MEKLQLLRKRSQSTPSNNKTVPEVQHIDLLDLHTIYQFDKSGENLNALYYLDAENNLKLSALGSAYSEAQPSRDQSKYLSKVDEIKVDRRTVIRPSDLLHRGASFLPSLASIVAYPISESASEPSDPQVKSQILKSGLEAIFQERAEAMADAHDDLAKSLGDISLASDDEAAAEQPQDSADDDVIATQVDLNSTFLESPPRQPAPFPLSPVTPSNQSLRQLYADDDGEKDPKKIPTTEEAKIVSFGLQSESIPAPPPLAIPTGTIKKTARVTKQSGSKKDKPIIPAKGRKPLPSDDKKVVATEQTSELAPKTILESLNFLGTVLSDLITSIENNTTAVNTLVNKISSFETKLDKTTDSITITEGLIANIDSWIKNRSLDQVKIVTEQQKLVPKVVTPLATATSTTPIPPTTEELEAQSKYGTFYDEHLKKGNMRTLTRELFVEISLMGGIRQYFKKVYPQEKQIEGHLDIIESGSGTMLNYQAIDRTLSRLTSKAHKESYLEQPASRAIYGGMYPPSRLSLGVVQETSSEPLSLSDYLQ
ncbi:VP4 [Cat Tien Hospitalitermes Lispi-like virus]|uniref:VP4 n=1 Tax=Cat Tien Hospitalitermes Lispi-like virus TaxID=2952743 RepID=A0AAE9NHW8_9MONO|nr:VP4 [Cat Tien Hospitalitermes Lispi-like virus]